MLCQSCCAYIRCFVLQQDGTKLLTCSADKTAKILDVATGTSQATQIAAHDGPISCVKWLDMPSGQGQGVCVTAGWDKMVKVIIRRILKHPSHKKTKPHGTFQYWDMRQPNPIATITATERIYALDAVDKLMVSPFPPAHSSCRSLT
jgi:mRNA export factor